MLADGETFEAIVEGLGCSPTYVSRWKKRFLEASLAGLHSRHLGKAAKVLKKQVDADAEEIKKAIDEAID